MNYIYNNHCFWFSVGILLYLGGSFFFNILANNVDQKEIDNYWHLTLITEFLKNVLFAIAIVVSSKKTNTSQNEKASVPFLDII